MIVIVRVPHTWVLAANAFAIACNSPHAPQLADAPTTPDALPDKLSVVPSLEIGAGLFFSCALRPVGSAACWGYGENGTLGDGSTANTTVPTAVLNLTGALTLSVSGYNACVLAEDRTVKCWGNDFDGELGDNGALTLSPVPVMVGNVRDAVQVAIGGAQGCALLANTTVECWGGPILGGDFRPALIPMPIR